MTKDLTITKKDADHFVSTMLEVIKKSVKKGEDVSLIGFGTFTKQEELLERVNPATGEKIKIKADTKFRQEKLGKK